MTDNPTDKQRVEARLDPATVAAAKESAYQRRQSLNAWAQEAFDFYLAQLAYEELVAPAKDSQ